MKLFKNKLSLIVFVFAIITVCLVVYLLFRNNKPIDIPPNKVIASNPIINPFQGWVKITKKDAGPNGYKVIYYRETSSFCFISCENPGYAKLRKIRRYSSYLVYPYDNMIKAIHYAYKQISYGHLRGQQIMPHTYIRIKWVSSSPDTNTADSELYAW